MMLMMMMLFILYFKQKYKCSTVTYTNTLQTLITTRKYKHIYNTDIYER